MPRQGHVYPFEIRVKDPELINIYRMLSKRRVAKIPDGKKNISIRIGMNIKPIRNDIFLGYDPTHRRSHVALPPEMDCFVEEHDSFIKVIFKPIF